MLRSSRPKAGQFPFGPLMRAKKRYHLRSQTAGKELNLTFCRKYLKCFSKGRGRRCEVLVWDWRSLKQSSRAMAAKFMRRVKAAEPALLSRSSLKLRKTKRPNSVPVVQRKEQGFPKTKVVFHHTSSAVVSTTQTTFR